MKRPSFQFYPSDWLRDTALRTCSCEARGLWMDMICFMHEGNPYGYLKVNRKVILPANLAVMVGVNLQDAERLLAELEECGVFERDEDGCIFSKRMVRDESLRNARAQGGKLGGNPALIKRKVNLKDNPKVENEDKQKPTPSSSSSPSSSKFIIPSLDEITEYIRSISANVDPVKFHSHYESNGWMVGKNKMKSWKAAITTWNTTAKPTTRPTIEKTNYQKNGQQFRPFD